jgi:flagellar basal body rod protein FlgC
MLEVIEKSDLGSRRSDAMVDVGAVALSGLYANEKRISVAANNIANAQSADYKAQEVQQNSVASGGVTSRVVERTPATVPVANDNGGVDQRPNVSLEEEVVNAQIASYGAQANLKVLQATDKLNKYLLDIQA